MRRIGISAIFIVFCWGIICGSAPAESDFEYRSEFAIEAEPIEQLTAEIEGDFRFNDDASEHYRTALGLELNYEVFDWLEPGVGFTQIFKKKSDEWKKEDRLYLQVAVKWELGDWDFKNRARITNRDKQGKSSKLRFRDKLTIKSPWKWTELEIQPYAEEEIFIQEQDHFYKNRVYGGLELELSDHIDLEIYYLWELEKDDDSWSGNIHAVGTELKLKY